MSGLTYVIWNPSAGSAAKGETVAELLSHTAGVRFVRTTRIDDASRVTQEAIDAGASRVIAAGGDGTVHAVMDRLARSPGHDTALAVLPLGTGNDLARSLGMPLDLGVATDLCLSGPIHRVDVVRARFDGETRYLANMATGGNTGQYTGLITPEMKQFWGPFCYLRGALDVAQELTIYDIEVETDGGEAERYEALNVFLANGRFSGGGLQVAPHALLDDGVFNYLIVRDGTPFEIALLTAEYVFSDFLENELVVHGQARRLTLRSAPDMPFSADGDLLTERPIIFELVPRALPVVVGPNDPAISPI